MHWGIAWKCCDEWRFSTQTQSTDNKGETKNKRTENLHLQQGNKVVLTSGTYRNVILQYLPLQSITAFLPVLDSCGFIPNNNKGVFVHSAVNWNSYKCRSATSCCCRSHMTIAVIEHENAFVKRRVFFFPIKCIFTNSGT